MAKKKLMDDKEFKKKAIKYVEVLLSGKKVTEKIKYADFEFTVAYPLPFDLIEIDQKIAEYCKGLSPKDFTPKALYSFEVYATLDKIVVDGPEWIKTLESWDKCPFDALVTYLYRRWLRFYNEVRIYLTPSILHTSDGRGDTSSPITPDAENVDDGPFSGVAYRSENTKPKS